MVSRPFSGTLTILKYNRKLIKTKEIVYDTPKLTFFVVFCAMNKSWKYNDKCGELRKKFLSARWELNYKSNYIEL